MASRSTVLLWIVGLGVIDAVVPGLPVLGLILIYVVLSKPPWFPRMVRDLYGS